MSGSLNVRDPRREQRLRRTLGVILAMVLCVTFTVSAAPVASAQETETVDGIVRIGDEGLAGVEIETDDTGTISASDGSFTLTTTAESKLVTVSRDATPAFPELHTVPRFTLSRVVDFEAATSTSCPDGFAPDGSLGGMCARFEPASQNPPSCPDGARGTPGGCYILVAKEPSGTTLCPQGRLIGTQCVIEGDPPMPGPSTCPVSATVLQDGDECYTLIVPPTGTEDCVTEWGYVAFGTICKQNNTGTTPAEIIAFACPSLIKGRPVTPTVHTVDGITKVESCSYTPWTANGECPFGTTPDPNGIDCREPVDLQPGAPVCAAGFGVLDGKCIRYEAPVSGEPQCPADSLEDDASDCRKPVADATGSYFCEDDGAALNGTSCVFTAPAFVDLVDIELPELIDLEIIVEGGYYSNCDYAGAIAEPCIIDDFCTTELAQAGECDENFVQVFSGSSAGQYAGQWVTFGDTIDRRVVLPVFANSTGVVISVFDIAGGPFEFAWDGNNPTTIDFSLDSSSPPALWYVDSDDDGFGDVDAVGTRDFPTGNNASRDNSDCDDDDASINPIAIDIPDNEIDENCDGHYAVNPDGERQIWFLDKDSDSFGDEAVAPVLTNDRLPGTSYSSNNRDCNDDDARINPFRTDIVGNGIDENCDGQDARLVSGVVLAGDQPMPGVLVESPIEDTYSELTGPDGRFDIALDGTSLRRYLLLFTPDWAPPDLVANVPIVDSFIATDIDISDPNNVVIQLPPVIQLEVRLEVDCGDVPLGTCPTAAEPLMLTAFDDLPGPPAQSGLWYKQVATEDGRAIIPVFSNLTSLRVDVPGTGVTLRRAEWDGSNPFTIRVQPAWFLDGDGDGFGDPESEPITAATSPGPDYVANGQDCNDDDPGINPDAVDLPFNDIDEDCDGNDSTAVRRMGTITAGGVPIPGVAVFPRAAESDGVSQNPPQPRTTTNSSGQFDLLIEAPEYSRAPLLVLSDHDDRELRPLFFGEVAEPLLSSNNIDIDLPPFVSVDFRFEHDCGDEVPLGDCPLIATPLYIETAAPLGSVTDPFVGEWDNFASTDTGFATMGVLDNFSTLNVWVDGEPGRTTVEWDGSNPFVVRIPSQIWSIDVDGDGFGDPDGPVVYGFEPPAPDYVNNAADCNDSDPAINPDAVDIPANDIDEDCDGNDALPFWVSLRGTITVGDDATSRIQPVSVYGQRWPVTSDGSFAMPVRTWVQEAILEFVGDATDEQPALNAELPYNPQTDREVDLALPSVEQLDIIVFDNHLPSECSLDLPLCRSASIRTWGNLNLDPGTATWHNPPTNATNGQTTHPIYPSPDTTIEITIDGQTTTHTWDGTNPFEIAMPRVWFLDSDTDGFGDTANSVTAPTSPGPDYVANDLDCNDNDPATNPDATDLPFNDIDEDCDGNDARPFWVSVSGTITLDGDATNQIQPLSVYGQPWPVTPDGNFTMPVRAWTNDILNFAGDATNEHPALNARLPYNPQTDREVDLALPPIEQLDIIIYDTHLPSECSLDLPLCRPASIRTWGNMNLNPGTATWHNPPTNATNGQITQPIYPSPDTTIAVEIDGQITTHTWDGTNPFEIDLREPLPTCFGRTITIDLNRIPNSPGTPGDDVILGTPGPDVIQGLGGNDIICSLHGNDEIDGGEGNDLIDSGEGNDTIVDLNGDNEIRTRGGDDDVRVAGGTSLVLTGSGDDTLRALNGNHVFGGGLDHDVLIGSTGNETMYGGPGNDQLFGLGGTDTLHGGIGRDACWFVTGTGSRSSQCEQGTFNQIQ